MTLRCSEFEYVDAANGDATSTLTDCTVTGNVTLYLNGSTAIDGSVFGGGEQSDVNGNTNVNIESGSVSTDVYGGGMQGDITGNVTVNIGKEGTTTTPTIGCDVYGGGALANTNTSNVTEGYGTDNETIPSTTTNQTTVNLKGGVITGDAYGGGLGSADIDGGVEAKVYGDVSVYQSGTILVPAYTADSIATSGRIFGCNNVNGTPLGHVLVYIENTTAKMSLEAPHPRQSQDDAMLRTTLHTDRVLHRPTSMEVIYTRFSAAATPGVTSARHRLPCLMN